MAEVIIALGSNLGDRLANLQGALRLLGERGLTVQRLSSVWETEPVPADQPMYLNAVLTGTTSLAPLDLLITLKAIERDLGRQPGRRWGPRPIDLDILFYDDLSLDSPELTIPHPRIAGRAFVLAPLAEIVDGPLPVLRRAVLELMEAAGMEGARRTELTLTANPDSALGTQHPALKQRGGRRTSRPR